MVFLISCSRSMEVELFYLKLQLGKKSEKNCLNAENQAATLYFECEHMPVGVGCKVGNHNFPVPHKLILQILPTGFTESSPEVSKH